MAKHRRAERLEQERIKAEREEMQRREKARRERRQKRRDYLTMKADSYEAYLRLENLWTILQPQMTDEPNNPATRIIRSLGHILEASRLQFITSTLEGEVRNIGFFADEYPDDVLSASRDLAPATTTPKTIT